jgi:hypothetical protein
VIDRVLRRGWPDRYDPVDEHFMFCSTHVTVRTGQQCSTSNKFDLEGFSGD